MPSRLIEKILFNLWKKGLKKHLRDGNVLDIGCGNGFYSKLFNKKYIGIDKDEKAIDRARKLYPEKKFEVMNTTHLNFKDNEFETIFSSLVLHHLSDIDLFKTTKEIKRIIKKDGQIYIIDMVLPEKFKFLAYPLFF